MNDTQVLSKDKSESIGGCLTEVEYLTALKKHGKGKSPGTDGLPSEF